MNRLQLGWHCWQKQQDNLQYMKREVHLLNEGHSYAKPGKQRRAQKKEANNELAKIHFVFWGLLFFSKYMLYSP